MEVSTLATLRWETTLTRVVLGKLSTRHTNVVDQDTLSHTTAKITTPTALTMALTEPKSMTEVMRNTLLSESATLQTEFLRTIQACMSKTICFGEAMELTL